MKLEIVNEPTYILTLSQDELSQLRQLSQATRRIPAALNCEKHRNLLCDLDPSEEEREGYEKTRKFLLQLGSTLYHPKRKE